MIAEEIHVEPVGETSLMLSLGDEIDVALASVIGRISRRIQNECLGIREVTPSYTTILVEADATRFDMGRLGGELLKIAKEECTSDVEEVSSGKLIALPVYYHSEVGPDLEAVAKYSQLTREEVIAIHSEREYTVCTIGFAPGFAFLADVDEQIVIPRHSRPRSKVVRGSVGIAGRQTAVYPADTPGGWQIIGNCPLSLEDVFEVGDRVRFISIDRETYLQQGGHV